MRSSRLFAHDPKGIIPRMSWSPHNLYNLIARSSPQYAKGASFRQTRMSMYQQRWRSKQLLRGYHGDWIRETKFKRWYLPIDLPRLENNARQTTLGNEASSEERMPISSLFLRDVERRLDTVVFRCCFARSAREAKALVVQGKVRVNGVQVKVSGTLLSPGDLISVEPESIPLLSREVQKQAEMRVAAKLAQKEEEATIAAETTEEEEGIEGATKDADAGVTAAQGEETVQASDAASEEASAEAGIEEEAAAAAKKVIKNETQDASPFSKKEEQLPPGVLPFTLPPYASPFLFIPPYLEVSFNTCSAIYIRHPTITPVKSRPADRRRGRQGPSSSLVYKTDLPSPYPAGAEIYSLAWEHYNKNAPRTRSDIRRLKVEAKSGREGHKSARAKDEWKKLRAIRRGHDKRTDSQSQFVAGAIASRRAGRVAPRSPRLLAGKGSIGSREGAVRASS